MKIAMKITINRQLQRSRAAYAWSVKFDRKYVAVSPMPDQSGGSLRSGLGEWTPLVPNVAINL